MLERFAQTRTILENPNNQKLKRLIDSSIAKNGALLEGIIKGRDPLQTLEAIVSLMVESNIQFGTRFPKNLISCAREIALVWDSVSEQERRAAGINEEFCGTNISAGTYFGNRTSPKKAFGFILNEAEGKRNMIKRWTLLLSLQNGAASFERVQEYFLNEATDPLKLDSFNIEKDGTLVFVGMQISKNSETGEIEEIPGKITLKHNNLYPSVLKYIDMLSELKDAIAKRLVVAYFPPLF